MRKDYRAAEHIELVEFIGFVELIEFIWLVGLIESLEFQGIISGTDSISWDWRWR